MKVRFTLLFLASVALWRSGHRVFQTRGPVPAHEKVERESRRKDMIFISLRLNATGRRQACEPSVCRSRPRSIRRPECGSPECFGT